MEGNKIIIQRANFADIWQKQGAESYLVLYYTYLDINYLT